MKLARLAAVWLVLLLAGCGGTGEERGTATLWITRDRGAEVLFQGTVPAGLTVIQALRREAEVETRYGGRFVQAIDGVEGSLAGGRDWFFFVNGVSADRGAAEYRLRPGEIAWWDYRRWQGGREVQVVVGAFPEPFRHGYGGKRRPAVVRYGAADQREGAEAIGRLIGATDVRPAPTPAPAGANVFRILAGAPRFEAAADSAAGPYTFTFSGDAARLAREPSLVRFRYEGMP
ncbi:MAG: DUF4430 domain-containing protein [Gaiellaceae bacterium]